MLSKSRIISLFIKILVIQLLLIVVMGTKKTSFFVDEIWTFNLANSYYFPALLEAKGYFDRWLPGEFWQQLLVVAPEHRFAFGSVWYNQSMDVHPPLFYSVVHTVCSFFPNEFNKWFVIVPNLVFFVATQIVLLASSIKLFGNSYMALMPCLFYGFTLGSVNSVLYLRMYMLLTLWCMAALYLHFCLLDSVQKEQAIGKKCYVYLFLTYLLGFLTHYYFLVYAFFLSAVFGIYVTQKKACTDFRPYLFTTVGGFALSVACFPAMLKHIFGKGDSGYRGAEALENLYKSSFGTRLSEFSAFVCQDLGGDILLLALLLLAIGAVVKLVQLVADINVARYEEGYRLNISFKRPKASYELNFDGQVFFALYIFITTLLCFMVIVKVTSINDNRYILMLYPTIVLSGLYFISSYLDYLTGKKIVKLVAVVLLSFLSLLLAMRQDNIKFQDNNIEPAIKTVAEKYAEVPLIGVCNVESWHPIIEKALLLNKVQQTYLIKGENLRQIDKALGELEQKPEQLLMFITWDNEKKYEEIVAEAKQYTQLHEEKLLYQSSNGYNMGRLYLLE